jgi:acyl CoA:acetate/3-ketoacid CoA transferase alpha subunit
MGLKTNNSLVDVRLSKMEVAIENILFFMVASNFAINQLMEHEVTSTFIANVAFVKELKWTMMMANTRRKTLIFNWSLQLNFSCKQHLQLKSL